MPIECVVYMLLYFLSTLFVYLFIKVKNEMEANIDVDFLVPMVLLAPLTITLYIVLTIGYHIAIKSWTQYTRFVNFLYPTFKKLLLKLSK